MTNANGTVTTNTWTYENRLRTVTLATPATTTFTYDGDGLRRQTVTPAATTNFIWDGQDVLLETDQLVRDGRTARGGGEIVVDEKGFEPSTSSVRGRRSPS